MLAEFGVAHRVIDAQEVLAIEPALRTAAVKLAGGLHLPGDETGDCHKFTAALAELLHQRGVVFKFDTTVKRLRLEGSRVAGVATDGGTLEADAYVVALGSEAARMLRPLGIDLPIHPVKGYSLTIDLDEERAGAAILGDGRALQGDDHAARHATARGGHRRDRRLRHLDPSIGSRNRAAHSLSELFPQAARAPGASAAKRGRGCVP